jgi:two-component system chemotaxis response regulator CheB
MEALADGPTTASSNGAIVIAQHRSPLAHDLLASLIAMRTRLRVETPGHGQPVVRNRIYVSRPDLHLTVTPARRFHYVDGLRINYTLSSADPLLASAARAYGVIAIVLTGRGSDAADGIRHVHEHGGTVIVQDPASAAEPGMPEAAIRTGAVNRVAPLPEIGATLRHLMALLDANTIDGGPHQAATTS